MGGGWVELNMGVGSLVRVRWRGWGIVKLGGMDLKVGGGEFTNCSNQGVFFFASFFLSFFLSFFFFLFPNSDS